MADNMSPEQRSLTMSRIRSKNTKIELTLRKLLFAQGLRYRVHVRDIPGRPDLAFTKSKVAVFLDGDFWHGWQFDKWSHKLAPLWRAKIERTMARDATANRTLRRQGWRVVRIWEHELKAQPEQCVERVLKALRVGNARPTVQRMSAVKLSSRGRPRPR